MLERMFSQIGISAADVQAAIYRVPFKQGRWRKQLWKAFDEAIDAADVKVLNLLVGTPQDVRLAATLQLRKDPDPRRAAAGPLYIGFACECETWPAEAICSAARSLLESVAGLTPGPLSGGVFRAPMFNQAAYEIHDGANLQGEPKEFYDRISFDMQLDSYWTKARRLYPITLLGPKLASRVSAADATAAGALAVQERNGSLVIDAYPTVVETWDPAYLKATVALRKWLWPHTIQNPADAIGLGIQLPRR
jgi:hypothetical protein